MRDRLQFHYEAPEDGGGGEPAPEPPPQTVPDDSNWAVDQDEWNRTQQFIQAATPILQRVAYQMQQPAEPAYQEPAAPEPQYTQIDPWEPATIERYVEERINEGIDQRVQEVMGPYQPLLGYVATRESEQVARAHLDELHADLGTFNDDAAYLIAAPMIESGYDPRHALQTSATFMAEAEKMIRADERARVQEELEQLRGAGGAGAEGSGVGIGASEMETIPTGRDRYKVAVERALERRRTNFPVG